MSFQHPAQTDRLPRYQAKETCVDQAAADEEGEYTYRTPKNYFLTKWQKHSSGLAEMTEKSLANKAGHLEMLHGGKKESKAEKATSKQAKKTK